MEKINKPRVFLSHSSKDKKFIKKVYEDLRICKIEPWLDEFEIRDGKPFLKVIFEDGIPTCDIVIVYITENSIVSDFVKKEIDSALIKELNDKNVRILPYVEKEELRKKLRIDLQTLQIREWNKRNYNKILPGIISEIWMSYIEQKSVSLLLPIINEKLKLQLELEKIQNEQATPFTKSEIKEFEYLFSLFNRNVELEVNLEERRANILIETKRTIHYDINIIELLIVLLKESFINRDSISMSSNFDLSVNMILYSHIHPLIKEILKKNKWEIGNIALKYFPYLELRAAKLITTVKDNITFLDKMYRFYHWLGYKNLLVKKIKFKLKSEKK